jgi:hypothetical protein
MTKEQHTVFTNEEIVARHQAMIDFFEGKRPMNWSFWDLFIDDSTCLTSDGWRVAHWAVDTLRHVLGDDFLAKVKARMATQRVPEGLEPSVHPLFSLGFLPANDVPWVYANLIRMALQLALFQRSVSTNRFGRVRKDLRKNVQPITWIGISLQLEVARLGLQAGWDILFEPPLGTGRYADVCLTNCKTRLLVETAFMSMSVEEKKILAREERISRQLMDVEWHYDVRISGFSGDSFMKQQDGVAQLFQDIETSARETQRDGRSRQVPGPNGALLTVFRPTEATVGEPWGITFPTVEARIIERLVARLKDKHQQVKGSVTPVWVRLDEYAGLWQATRLLGMPLEELLKNLAPFLQQQLTAFPDLVGVILAPAVLWNGGLPLDELRVQIEQHGVRAVRCPLPGNWLRETIIIPQAGSLQAEQEARIFAEWYAHEDTWLDWALAQFEHPSFETLVQD